MKSMSAYTVINEIINSILNKIEADDKQDDSIMDENVSIDVAVANNQICIFESNQKNKVSNHQPQTTVEDSPAAFDSTLTDACSTGNDLKSLSNKLCMFKSNPDTLRPTSAPPLKMLNSFSLLFRIRPVKSDFLLAEEIKWSYKTKRETSSWIKNPVLKFDSYIYDEENLIKDLSFNKTDKYVMKKHFECFQPSLSLSQESNGNFPRKNGSFFQEIMIPNFLSFKNAYSVKEKSHNPCERLEVDDNKKKIKSYENFSIVNKFEKDSSIILNRIQNQIKYFCGDMNDTINEKMDLVEPICERTADKGKFTKMFLEKQHSDDQKDFSDYNLDKSMSDEVHSAGEKSKTFTPAATDNVEYFKPSQTQFYETNLIEKAAINELYAAKEVNIDFSNQKVILVKNADCIENKKAQTEFCESNLIENAPINELYAAKEVRSDFSNQKVILVKSADCIDNKKAQTEFCDSNLIEKAQINELYAAKEVKSGIRKQKVTLVKSFDVAGTEKNLHSFYKDNEFSKPADADRLLVSVDNHMSGKKVLSDEIISQHETVYQEDSAVQEELSSNCPNNNLLKLEDVLSDADCLPVTESDSLDSVEIPIFSGSSEYHSTESWIEDQSWTDTLNSSSLNSEKTYVLHDLEGEEKLCRPVVKSKSILEKLKLKSNRVSPSDLPHNAKRKSKFRQFFSDANKSIRGHLKTLRRSCKSKKSCKPKVFSSVTLLFCCM